MFKVWPFLFSHYPFESTIEERAEIDKKVTNHYSTLIKEWKNAEEIVMKIDMQHSNYHKNSIAHLELKQDSQETPISPFKNMFGKIPLSSLRAAERKDSNLSNEVFDEVYLIKQRIVLFVFYFLFVFRNTQHIL